LQLLALPIVMSRVQAFWSSQLTGQLPSQVSFDSSAPLPQLAEQSPSFAEEHPAGQHPSPFMQPSSTW
jgi:hypothetical protein